MAKNAAAPPADAHSDGAPQSFEAALAELEKIVQTMEAGTLPLEQSLAAHRRGIELAKYCQAKLAQAQAQVRVLEDDALKALAGDDAEG
jgi:exodeoxyribonuclease VII small subunit